MVTEEFTRTWPRGGWYSWPPGDLLTDGWWLEMLGSCGARAARARVRADLDQSFRGPQEIAARFSGRPVEIHA